MWIQSLEKENQNHSERIGLRHVITFVETWFKRQRGSFSIIARVLLNSVVNWFIWIVISIINVFIGLQNRTTEMKSVPGKEDCKLGKRNDLTYT